MPIADAKSLNGWKYRHGLTSLPDGGAPSESDDLIRWAAQTPEESMDQIRTISAKGSNHGTPKTGAVCRLADTGAG